MMHIKVSLGEIIMYYIVSIMSNDEI